MSEYMRELTWPARHPEDRLQCARPAGVRSDAEQDRIRGRHRTPPPVPAMAAPAPPLPSTPAHLAGWAAQHPDKAPWAKPLDQTSTTNPADEVSRQEASA